MIPVKTIYDSVKDIANSEENGQLKFSSFNRYSFLAENRIMDFLSGDVENTRPPIPYTSQKLKDWLSPFIATRTGNVGNGGVFDLPKDFYGWENSYATGGFTVGCVNGEKGEPTNVFVELLDGGEFTRRINTSIIGLEPDYDRPICKMVGGKLIFEPKDLGVATIEYIRKPTYAKIVGKIDPVYNTMIIDENASDDYEYGDWAAELIVYFITQIFATSKREATLVQHQQAMGKLVRDAK